MKRTGFTLVEILIVVIILGILAAIVVPQFTDASNQARLSSVQSDLQTARGQIELYKMQHSGNSPEDQSLTGAAGFWAQMIGQTDIDGVLAPNSEYGPYLQMAPTNPFQVQNGNPGNDVTYNGANADAGWSFDTTTGKLTAQGTDGSGDVDLTIF